MSRTVAISSPGSPSFQVNVHIAINTFPSIKPGHSAQAIEARLWGLATVKGAKTEDGKDVRAKMWDLFRRCIPGGILAQVKSGVNIQEFVAVQRGYEEAWPDLSSKRGLAVELIDAIKDGGGINMGQTLVSLGLVKEELREEKLVQGEFPYYVVRKEKEAARSESSGKLQVLRQHEAFLASRLEQFKMRALSEKNPEDSVRFEEIRQRIEDFQKKLEVIQERREKAEEEGIV